MVSTAHCSGRDIVPLDVDRDAFSYSVLTYRRHQYQWCQAAHCSGRDIAPLDVDRDAFSYSVLNYRWHQYQWCQQFIVLAVTLFHWMLTEMPSATLC